MRSRIQTWFNDASLKVKLLLLLLVAGILPLMFAVAYNSFAMRSRLTEQAFEDINTTNRQIASNLEEEFASVLQTLSMLSQDTSLIDALSEEYTADWDFVQAYRYIDHTLYTVLSTNTRISSIHLYIGNTTLPADGLFVHHLQDIPQEELAWMQYRRSAVGNLFFRPVHPDSKQTQVISIGCVLNMRSRTYPQGYLVADLKESALHSLFEEESLSNDIYILDEDEVIQSTREKALLGQSAAAVLQMELLPGADAPVTQKVNGRDAMLVSTELSNGWHVMTVVYLDAIRRQVTQALTPVMAVSLICVLVAFLLILEISHYFSQRFQSMNHQLQRIEQNDFHIEVTAVSNDEIGRFQAALGKMAQTLEETIHETYEKEMKRKDAELMLLQSQINPHLLYNALSGITSLALSGRNREAAEFTRHLSQFYKTSLNQGKRIVTIREEIAITQHYISIQDTRFPGMFAFTWEVDETLLEKTTIKLILQPFVENIVNHAVRTSGQLVQTLIRIGQDGESVLFCLQDNGAGIPQEKLDHLLDPQRASGYGLINVDARIQLAYGSDYGVQIESRPETGTTAMIRIPLTEEEGEPYDLDSCP